MPGIKEIDAAVFSNGGGLLLILLCIGIVANVAIYINSMRKSKK